MTKPKGIVEEEVEDHVACSELVTMSTGTDRVVCSESVTVSTGMMKTMIVLEEPQVVMVDVTSMFFVFVLEEA